MKIYVASSWRNHHRYPKILKFLRILGHDCYDFKNPVPGNYGFSWKQVTGTPKELWTPKFYRDEVLTNTLSVDGFNLDMNALKACDACVLVLPCGRSAHLELGYAVGAGKKTAVFMDEVIDEPELMYKMVGLITSELEELAKYLA